MARFNPEQQEKDVPSFYRDVDQGSRPGGGLVQEAGVVDKTVKRHAPFKPFKYEDPAMVDYSGMDIALFADVLDKGIKTVDTGIQLHIQDKLTDEYESAQNELGVGDVAEAAGRALPEELSSQAQFLEGLTAARKAGRLSDIHYWGRLEAAVKQMKSRFPGYKEDIDKIISGLAGSKPANALRRSLLAELEAGATDSQKLVEQMANEGSLPADWQQRQEGVSELSPYSYNQLITIRSQWNSERANLTYNKDKLAYKSAVGDATEDDAYDVLNNEVNVKLDRILSTSGENGLSDEIGRHYELLRKAAASRQQGGEPYFGSIEDIRTNFANIRATTMTMFEDIISQVDENGFSYARMLSPEKVDELRQGVMKRIGHLENDIVNENWGILSMDAADAKARADHAKYKVSRNDALATIGAVKDVAGAEFVSAFYTKNLDALGPVNGAMVNLLNSAAINDENSSLSNEFIKLKDQGVKDPEAFRQASRTSAELVSSPDANPRVVKDYVRFLFGPENYSLLASIPKEDKIFHFKTLLSAPVREKMLELKAQGDMKSWESYSRWVKSNYSVLFGQEIEDIRNALVDNRVGIGYDGDNHRWTVEYRRPSFPINTNVAAFSSAERSVQRLNEATEPLAALLKEEGVNPNNYLWGTFTDAGVNINAEEEPGDLLEMLFKSLQQYVESAPETKDPASGHPTKE